MRRTTKKLSGAAKDRFLRGLIAEEPGVPADAAERLVKRGADAISSLRVRKTTWSRLRPATAIVKSTTAPARPAPNPSAPPAPPTAEQGHRDRDRAEAAVNTGIAPGPSAFDPYVFGLVPTLQREGREGLIQRLVAIGDVANLRKMARTQQIALSEPAKSSDVDIATLSEAIADSVAKRIADRRAAAG